MRALWMRTDLLSYDLPINMSWELLSNLDSLFARTVISSVSTGCNV